MGIQDARKKCIFYSGYICSAVLISIHLDDEVIYILLSMTQLEVLSDDDLGISRWGRRYRTIFLKQSAQGLVF